MPLPASQPAASQPELRTATTQDKPATAETPAKAARRIDWAGSIPFVLVHLAVFGAFWTGVTIEAIVCCAVLYAVRVFGITAGYHRYFAHRTYKTSRIFQFILAFLAQTSSQKGALWWAAHHRGHHLYSDTERDIHSPKQDGFWYSHMGWIFSDTEATEWKRIKDFAKYPELRFLNKYWALPPFLLGFGAWLAFDWSGLFIGFCLSTVLVWHSTFMINSLAHVFGTRRYETSDTSRNNWFLALLTFGEGWHNNHHYYMNSVRQGFFWWEIDISYYILRVLSWFGIVWDLKLPPKEKVLAFSQGKSA